MATLSATFPVKSASGGISDAQNTTLAGAGGTASITVGIRQIFAISTAGPIYIRFSSGANSAATTADIHIPGANISQWDMGEEFDRVNFLNDNGASTTVVSVFRLNRAG